MPLETDVKILARLKEVIDLQDSMVSCDPEENNLVPEPLDLTETHARLADHLDVYHSTNRFVNCFNDSGLAWKIRPADLVDWLEEAVRCLVHQLSHPHSLLVLENKDGVDAGLFVVVGDSVAASGLTQFLQPPLLLVGHVEVDHLVLSCLSTSQLQLDGVDLRILLVFYLHWGMCFDKDTGSQDEDLLMLARKVVMVQVKLVVGQNQVDASAKASRYQLQSFALESDEWHYVRNAEPIQDMCFFSFMV
jgi:hypothetical protein